MSAVLGRRVGRDAAAAATILLIGARVSGGVRVGYYLVIDVDSRPVICAGGAAP